MAGVGSFVSEASAGENGSYCLAFINQSRLILFVNGILGRIALLIEGSDNA